MSDHDITFLVIDRYTGKQTTCFTIPEDAADDLVFEITDPARGMVRLRTLNLSERFARAALKAAERFVIGVYIFFGLVALHLFARA